MRSFKVRPSPIAGQWYPGQPHRLRTLLQGLFDRALQQTPQQVGEIVGVIAPHAGIRYSGQIAAYAFAPLYGQRYPLVALVGPMHYPYAAPVLTTAHLAYETPLGQVMVAHDLLKQLDQRLREEVGLSITPVANDPEHSLEMVLIFVQSALSSPFRLLPLMLRTDEPEVLQVLGYALGEVTEEHQGLLVASTDLSHYYPQETAEILDAEMIRRIVAMDPKGVLKAEEEGKGYACGKSAVATVLWAGERRGVTEIIPLGYTTSGEVSGDTSSVVGYFAAVLVR